MNTTKRNYETLYVVDATLTDEQVDSAIEKYSQVITGAGGEIQAAGRWDKRRLAYEVQGRREGIYILTYFTGEPEVSKELDRVFRLAEDVIRHIIVRIEPQHIDTSRLEQQAQRAAEAEAEAPAAEVEAEQAPEAPAQEVAEQPEATDETTEEPAAAETAAEEPAAEEAGIEEA